MRWIPLTERMPTREDGDEEGRLLVRCQDGWIVTRIWSDRYSLESSNATHFARIRDIELPPPAPVMPERIEYVRAQPGEGCNGNGFWFNPETSGICTASYMLASSGYALYRRVEPKPRIVFEVGEKYAPKKGEWFLHYDRTGVGRCNADCVNETRTILRLVEGEEYLK